jgi:serine/threonine protein kinase
MELAEGSLADLLEVHLGEYGKPIPAKKVCSYLSQVAKALDFLNARQHRIDGNLIGIQHCDVKPPNMLLFDETVKLADFGLSVQTVANRQTHLPAGTLSYTAPEVFRSQLSDRMDQYSLAVCYYASHGPAAFPRNRRISSQLADATACSRSSNASRQGTAYHRQGSAKGPPESMDLL